VEKTQKSVDNTSGPKKERKKGLKNTPSQEGSGEVFHSTIEEYTLRT
jgi:hypothetical protein